MNSENSQNKPRKTAGLLVGARLFLLRAKNVWRHPIFPILTLVGNGTILMSACVLFGLEKGENPKIHTILDALWWSVATAATVGYGDISPVTVPGKILGIVMMIFGTALFSSFTALFAAVLVAPEFSEVEKEMEGVGRAIRDIEKEIATDEAVLHQLLSQLEGSIESVREIQKKRGNYGPKT